MPGTVRLCIFPPFCPPPARGELSRHCRNLPFLGFTAVVSARPPACMPRSCPPDARPPPPAVHSISPSAARDREGCPAARFRASCTDHRGAFLPRRMGGRRAGRDDRAAGGQPQLLLLSLHACRASESRIPLPCCHCRQREVRASLTERGEYIGLGIRFSCMRHADRWCLRAWVSAPVRAQTYDHKHNARMIGEQCSGAVFLPARGFCCCRARSGSARSS